MKFYRASLAVIFVVLLSPRLANAGNFVLTIGGGYSPAGNQASLEKNVLLFQRVLAGHSGTVERHDIFFADGNNAAKDLQVHDPGQVPLANRLMAEFFGSIRDLGLSYRNHQVPNVRSAARPANVKAWFAEAGPQMKDGDKLTIYVTAHGHRSRDRDQEYNTSIAMWGNSTLPMTEARGGAIQHKPSASVKPWWRRFDQRIADAIGEELNGLHVEPCSGFRISAGFRRESSLANPLVVRQQLAVVSQHILDRCVERLSAAKPLQNHHPERDHGGINRRGAVGLQPLKFIIADQLSQQINSRRKFLDTQRIQLGHPCPPDDLAVMNDFSFDCANLMPQTAGNVRKS